MASLLDEFYILFSSDAEDVKKGAEDAEKAIDDLEGGIEEADDTATELGASFGEMAKQAGLALLALASIGAARDGILNTAASVDELGKFSARLGENIEEIDAWGGAAVRAGGSAAGFRSSLESLNEKVVDTAIKGTGELLPFFNRMGIAMVNANGQARSTLDILPELADAFQTMSKQESAGIGRKLGLDDGTILLLQNGRKELETLLEKQKELGVVTKEQALLAEKFNDQMADMGQAFNTVGRLIAIELLPFFTKVMDQITSLVVFLAQNKAFAVSFFGAIAAVITTLLIPALITAVKFAAPFLLIAAAVVAVAAAFALAADDVYNFIQGNDSAIGELVKKWDGFKNKFLEMLEDIKKSYNEFIDDLPDISIDGAIEAAKSFIGISSDSPINNQTPNTISNSTTRGGDKTIKFGDIKVDASGNDSESAGRVMGHSMQKAIRRAVDSFDDGVLS